MSKPWIAVAALIFFAGCANQAGLRMSLDTWIGKTEEQLVEQRGAPTGTYTTSEGTRILIYSNQRDVVSGAAFQGTGGVSTDNVGCTIQFFLDGDSRIKHYVFTGPDCEDTHPINRGKDAFEPSWEFKKR